MKRGEVYWVAFDPTVGEEIRKTRPAVIVSRDSANRLLNRLVMVPLSSKTERVTPGEAMLVVRGSKQKALPSQIRTVSKVRVLGYFGELTRDDMKKLEAALIFQLGLGREVIQ